MKNLNFLKSYLFWVVIGACLIMADQAWGQIGVGNFESKMNNLNRNLVSRVLPLVSTCGLIYAAFLMAIGNAEARSKAMAVIGGSILGFLAPTLIRWLAGAF